MSKPVLDCAGDDWHRSRVRVRYPEVDPQGVVHHAVYLHYLEIGRTELLRDLGTPYRDIERSGLRLMVTECGLRYLGSGRYDDVLVVKTRVSRVTKVRIFLLYEVVEESSGRLLCEASTTLAAIGATGRPCALPDGFSVALTSIRRGSGGASAS
jgi:acyl-CoA thioester hydrolase